MHRALMIASAALVVLAGPAGARQAPVVIGYEWQMAALTPDSRALLAPVVEAGAAGGATIVVEGHADIAEGDMEAMAEEDVLRADPTFARADPELLVSTSQRRALVVRDYLVTHGVPAHAIEMVGVGASRPVVAGTSPRNRRVEVRLSRSGPKGK